MMTSDGDKAYKTVYVTVDPDEWAKQKDPVRDYVHKTLLSSRDLGADDSNKPGVSGGSRLRRAVQKSLSSDLKLPSDCVPWQSVVGEEQTDELLKQKRKQEKHAKHQKKLHSSLRDLDPSSGKHERGEALKGKKKEKDPNKETKIAFYRLLNNPAPEKGCSKKSFDPDVVCKMMDKLPVLAKDKFAFTAFHEPITALHMLCATDAPLQCIKKCYKLNHEALHDTSSTLGSPLHYACSYNASVETVRYLASKDTPALLLLNRAKRTALHLACATKKPVCELVVLLTAAGAEAAELQDSHGLTPLHLACSAKRPDLEIVEDLTEVCPEAVCLQDQKNGATPLHMALENKTCDIDIVKDLVGSNTKVLKVADTKGRLPLHLAVQANISAKVIKAMVKKYPKSLSVQDVDGETPYQIAKSMHLDKEILKLLKPH